MSRESHPAPYTPPTDQLAVAAQLNNCGFQTPALEGECRGPGNNTVWDISWRSDHNYLTTPLSHLEVASGQGQLGSEVVSVSIVSEDKIHI